MLLKDVNAHHQRVASVTFKDIRKPSAQVYRLALDKIDSIILCCCGGIVQRVALSLVGWPDDWCGQMTGGTRYSYG
jgi:hypothetical protein